MRSSRKTDGTQDSPAAIWHRLEVPVPATPRLTVVAGGIPGRAPPHASRVVDAIADAACELDTTGSPYPSTWLVAPSRRVGNQWIESLARTGRPVANVHVTTISALAYDIVAEDLASDGIELAAPRAKLVVLERILTDHRDGLRFFGAAPNPARLAESLLASIEAIRMAGLSPAAMAAGLRHTPKARDLRLIMEHYLAALHAMRLIDTAGEVSRAVDRARAGRLPATVRRLFVPDDLELRALEADLVAAIEASGLVEVRRLEADAPLEFTADAIDSGRFTIFRAAGESNEVRHVLRTCLALGIAFDEVEIVHTDASTYPSLVREIVSATALATAPTEGDEGFPVTFAEGLPLADSRPGIALNTWLRWRRDGHPQSGLERLLQDGLLDLGRRESDGPAASALVRELRGVRIGRGLDRTIVVLSESLARTRAQRPEAFFRADGDADGDLDDAAGHDAAALASRKRRREDRLGALIRVVRRLATCEGSDDGVTVLEGARLFIDSFVPSGSEFDGNAKNLLLEEVDAMVRWQQHAGLATGEALSPHAVLDWLERLPSELVVLGSGPRAGCLHVSGLAHGGHSGRPYTFVLGLDENRFPGAGATDPVLSDGDRERINASNPSAALTTAKDGSARNQALLRRLLSRSRGRVWLGYTCRDTTEDAEVFPTPALVELHAAIAARPHATLADLLRSLPPPECYVPADASTALDETQWWLAVLGPDATPDHTATAIRAHRDHLSHGHAAEASRASDAFTPHDGNVPLAGPQLDPRAADGRIASARSLETLGGCPRRFFFRYGLGVEPFETFDDDADRWLDARETGSLLHGVLERFMRQLVERGEVPVVERHLDDLLTLLDAALEDSRRSHPPLTELSFIARRTELVTAMHTFLHEEERACRESGTRPVALEASIGLEPADSGTPFDSHEPVEITLAPGETIRVAGRIDRIDLVDPNLSDSGGVPDQPRSYRLWDYKSGTGFGFPASAAQDPFDGGRKLQHGLYVLMMRERLAAPGCDARGGRVERFGYFFPTRAGRGRRLEWTSEQLEGCTHLVRQLAEIVRQGAFLPTSRIADCTHCDFLTVCGDPTAVVRQASRLIDASEKLARLFDGLRSVPRPAAVLDRRGPLDTPLTLTSHPPGPKVAPDEPVRSRIRNDLDTSLLVEAAAGTGKTTCMVDRMLALVRTGRARPERIVAVTFTRKAAAELRRRFREKLQESATNEPEPLAKARLEDAVGRVDAMVIGTIHSFAGRLLRERPIESGVDPGFEELDEATDRLLRRQAWRDFVTAAPCDHADLVARLDSVGLQLGDFSRLFLDRFATYGDIDHWPAPQTPAPDTGPVLAALEAFCGRIEAEVFPAPADRGSDELMNALEQFARMFRRLDRASTVAVMDLLQELERSPKLTQASWPGTGDTEAEVRASRKARAVAWEAAWKAMRDATQVTVWQWRAHRYPLAVEVLQGALRVYDRLREERGCVSFQDLLCKSASLLVSSPEARESFRERYTHILVDEFQDTDPVQAEMLLLLTADDPTERDWRHCRPVPGSLFVVGDPKQSLYRFRRADIVTYSTVRAIVQAHGDVLSLTTNFRSRSDLVDWANRMFAREFPPEATIHSPSFTPSHAGRRESQASTDAASRGWLCGVRTLRFVRSGTAGDAWAEQEAHEIASFIRCAVDSGLGVPRTADEVGRGVGTACRAGDFLVIARERRHLGIYAAALHAAGLPVDVSGTLGEDQAEPLRELRHCLAVLAEPDDPVAVLALLRGALFGFSDGELFAYSSAGGRFDGWLRTPPDLDGNLRSRLDGAREAVQRWRHWAGRLPSAAAVERIIDDAGLALIAAHAAGEAGPGGRAIVGLMQKFVERIRLERLQVVTIRDCLELLDDMIDAAARGEFDPLSIDVPSGDRVRIMNLHKAKGLEAAVVFLADYQCREAGEKPEDGPFLHIDRSGARTEGYLAATTPYGRSHKIIAAPPAWTELCLRERAFEQAEQIRLDYVAATRAGTCMVVSLFERRDAGSKSRPEIHTAEGAWQRFAGYLEDARQLPAIRPSGAHDGPATPRPATTSPPPNHPSIDVRAGLLRCRAPTFARLAPREVLTEPAEAIRFSGEGLGEPWGRAIHRLLELASHAPSIDVVTAARTAFSNEAISSTHLERAVETVRAVMKSDVWRRSQASRCRLVEVPFSIQVRGDDLPERLRGRRDDTGLVLPTVVRGVIDMVFEEPDGERKGLWTVVDWKTDSVHSASESLLEEHYRPQVELYAACWRCLDVINASKGDPRTP